MYIQYILYYIEHTFENYYFYVSIFFVINNYFCSTTFVIYNRDVPFVTRSVPNYYFSLGRIILSRIATIAAGTIPEPPKTSWSS